MRTHEATRNGVAAILASTLVLPVEARAQEPAVGLSPVVVGSRVRIMAPTAVNKIEGIVATMDDASLLVSTDDRVPVRVPRQAITRLEVSTGRHRRTLKGLIIGVGIGAGLGAGLGAVNFSPGCLDSCPDQQLEAVGFVCARRSVLRRRDRRSDQEGPMAGSTAGPRAGGPDPDPRARRSPVAVCAVLSLRG